MQVFANSYSYITTAGPTTTAPVNPAAVAVVYAFAIIFIFLAIIALWKVFTKAGKPGWAAIVPLYNGWVLAEIAGKPGWWVFLEIIPIVNFFISVIIAINIARNFGKSDVFGIIGVWAFSLIGYLILAFGPAQYHAENKSYGAPDDPTRPDTPAGEVPKPSMPPQSE